MPAAQIAPDRRTKRTRAAVMTAFTDLLLARGYDGLSVSDICERANVGRSTFYEHFNGRDDIMRQSLQYPLSRLADIVGTDKPASAFVPIMAHMYENRRLARVMFGWPMRAQAVRMLAAMLEPKLAALAKALRATLVVPKGLAAAQIAEAQLGLVEHWLTGKTACRPEAVAQALHATANATARALMGDS